MRCACVLTRCFQDEDSPKLVPPYADEATASGAVDLTGETHAVMEKRYPLLLVNFYAPWCPWSQRLAPIFEVRRAARRATRLLARGSQQRAATSPFPPPPPLPAALPAGDCRRGKVSRGRAPGDGGLRRL
jgi:hypothetical protein